MEYLHTMIRISDIDTSLHFFCELLGMVEIRRTENEAARYTNVFLAAPGDSEHAKAEDRPLVELTYNWPDEHGNTEKYTGGRNFGHLAYRVKNIYETCKHLMEHGITINRPPRDGRMAFIKTPDGISIELLQEGSPLPLQEPWKSMENTGSW